MDWRFMWRRDLFEWEAEMLRHLICEIGTAAFRNEGPDSTMWPADLSNCYSVKSAYSILSEAPNPSSQIIINKVWNKFMPLKVSVFAWQVIQNRFPSKENLVKRGILTVDAHFCEGGYGIIESTSHLFLECPTAVKVWSDIICWLGVSASSHNQISDNFIAFSGVFQGKKSQETGLRIIWLACLWSIWKARNAKIFQNKDICCSSIVEETKLLS
ncbi:uncharacterized protein LOC131642190 [Vicia villosa]|uniref:uncharacterized protein LOC131642190 n=1 Tax=Vicia villosa TaxID=3911 RepID=UPI00273AE8FA|nr:uncharacterized protein LOC131642190 [Vicia villosa]